MLAENLAGNGVPLCAFVCSAGCVPGSAMLLMPLREWEQNMNPLFVVRGIQMTEESVKLVPILPLKITAQNVSKP